jgi:hypothetical protein
MPASDYTPTLEQVAALIRARTRDSGGQETGTFSADTEPTADEEIGAVDEPQWPAYGGFGPVSGWDDRKF